MLQRVKQAADAAVGFIVQRSSSSATGNLQEWQNESGTVLAAVKPDGTVNAASSATISAKNSSTPNITAARFSNTNDGHGIIEVLKEDNSSLLFRVADTGGLNFVPRNDGAVEWAIFNDNTATPFRIYSVGVGRFYFVLTQDRLQVSALQLGSINAANGLSDVKILGRQTTRGVPTGNTWSTNDAIIDSAGGLHLCTSGGTPGTWIGDGWRLAGFWKAGSAAQTSGAITVPAFDELMIVCRVVSLSAGDIVALQFNSDTGNNYRSRYIVNNATSGVTLTDVPTATTNMARLSGISDAGQRTITAVINNRLGTAKVGTVVSTLGTGSVSTQHKIDLAGGFEWVNTSAQITSVTMLTAGGTATMATDSGFQVFGRDFA